MVTVLETFTKEATNGIISPIHGTVENIVKQAVDRDAADKAISSTLNWPTNCENFAQDNVKYIMKTPPFTASTT